MLSIYIGSLGITIAEWILLTKAIYNKLKREGYIKIDKKNSLSELIIEAIPGIPLMLIPIVNVIIPTTAIFKFNDFYKSYVETLLKKGDIILSDNSKNDKINDKKKKNKIENEDNQTIIENTYEDRFLLNAKSKTEFFERITKILVEIDNIKNKKAKSVLIDKLKNVTILFNQANLRFENMDSTKLQLLNEDKITIEVQISQELDNIEHLLQQATKKQERIENDIEQFDEIFSKIKKMEQGK